MNDTGTAKPYETLAGADDKAAAKKFGRIGTVMRDRVAFETLRVRRALSAIDELPEDADIADFEKVFGDLDQVEAAEYHRIAKSRLDVIERFRQLAPEARERVVQEYLFGHPWLLHPSWERPTSNNRSSRPFVLSGGRSTPV